MNLRPLLPLILLSSLISIPALAQAQGNGSGNGLAAQVTALQTQVTALQTQVNALQTQAGSVQAQVNTLQTNDAATQSQIATLETSVNKLNGQISASDLSNTTWAVYGFQNEFDTPVAGPGGHPAAVGSYVYAGTAALNADGTGALNVPQFGNYLVFGQLSLVSADNPGGPASFNWTYNNGILTISNVSSPDASADTETLSVTAGGRIIVGVHSKHTDGTDVLLIFTRLQ